MRDTVEVSELAQVAHEAVSAARAGRTIVVTDAGRPVADLRPHRDGMSPVAADPPAAGVLGFADITLPPPLANWRAVEQLLEADRRGDP